MSLAAAPLPTLALPERLVQADMGSFLAQARSVAQQACAGRSGLVVDASGLRHFDSSALALLLALRREVLQAGATWSWQGANNALRDLAALYGVWDLLSGPDAPKSAALERSSVNRA